MYRHLHHGSVGRRREQRLKIYWGKNERKVPQLGEGHRHTSSESAENPKQDQPKAHSKTS